MDRLKILLIFAIGFIFLLVFKSWFLPLSLSTGDWVYKFPQSIIEFIRYPYAWDLAFQNGLGGNTIFLLALNTYFYASTAFLSQYTQLPWIWIEKIMWYWPFIAASILGSYLLFRNLISKDPVLALISSLIFTTNTYSLMITGGGQMGVGMGYAMIPAVVWGFVRILEEGNKLFLLKRSVLAGLLFSLQLLFDLRIAYVTLILLGIYYLIFIFRNKFWNFFTKTFLFYALIPGLTIVALHFFWLFPFVLIGQNPLTNLGETYTNIGIVKFLSFATFENTISLLHPNWPDNLFGKEYFMRPEFLVFPILAFTSLIFLKTERKGRVLVSFAFIALLGAFLAKGASEPFGEVYIWLFQKFPGFIMFRDSTKWYGFVALSFSILIPYTLAKVSDARLKTQATKYLLLVVFLVFWMFTIRQSILGELRGTFAPKESPPEYAELADYLTSQPGFFRTMWLPGLHQYSYSSVSHPAIPGGDFLSVFSNSDIAKKLSQPGTILTLENSSIKYVIVPFDTEGKLFTEDRKYSEKKYQSLLSILRNNKNFTQAKSFGKIVVFENSLYKNHMWIVGSGSVTFRFVSPVEYEIEIKDAALGDKLYFSENFDPNWAISIGDKYAESKKNQNINSFSLPEGSYSARLYYTPQNIVNNSIPFSIFSGIVVVAILVWRVPEKKGKKKDK